MTGVSDHAAGEPARAAAGVGGTARRATVVLGWILIALALAALGYEAWLALQTGAYRMVAAGELWFRLDVGSLNLSQAIVQRYVHPALWEPGIVTLLRWPAWSLLGAAGVVLVLAFSKRRRS